jgi:hypothetical protein
MTSVNAQTLRDSAVDAIDQVQRAAAPAIKEGKRQAGVLLDQSGALIDTVGNRVSETIEDLGESIIAFTKKNPLIALLVAAGAGVLLITAVKSVNSRR